MCNMISGFSGALRDQQKTAFFFFLDDVNSDPWSIATYQAGKVRIFTTHPQVAATESFASYEPWKRNIRTIGLLG